MRTILYYLAELLENLTETDLRVTPCSPIAEGEKTLGEASDGSRRVYALWQRSARDAAEAMSMLQFGVTSAEDQEQKHAAAKALQARVSLVGEMFWTTLKNDLELWGHDRIGIRAGWQVVDMPASEEKRLPLGLEGLLGGIEIISVMEGRPRSGRPQPEQPTGDDAP